MMAGGTQHPSLQPFSNEDIVGALEAAGYPFEIALYKKFADAGMNPILGSRLKVRRPEQEGRGPLLSKEVDLVASIAVHSTVFQSVSQGQISALIDAKRLHPPARFVGILGEQPSEHEKRIMRSYFFGCPSLRVLPSHPEDSYSDHYLSDDGIARVFDAFGEAPVCAHWAVVARKEKLPWASHDQGFFEGMETLVAAASYSARETSLYMESMPPKTSQLPYIGTYVPTLIVDTPSLLTYDPHTRLLAEVDWLVLALNFEVADGITHRTIDVVTANGVDAMIERYKRGADLLLARLEAKKDALYGMGYGQRLSNEEQAQKRAADSTATVWPARR